MITRNKEKALKAIFFDAVGTLFYLSKTVGDHYALVGEEIGLKLDAQQLDRAIARISSRSHTNILPNPVFGSCIRRLPVFWKNYGRAFNWR